MYRSGKKFLKYGLTPSVGEMMAPHGIDLLWYMISQIKTLFPDPLFATITIDTSFAIAVGSNCNNSNLSAFM